MTSDARDVRELIETISLGSPDNSIGFVTWRLLHRYVRALDRELAPLGLTHLQFMTLIHVAWLESSGAVVTQTGLSRFGEIGPMQVSLMLKTLQAKGLVARVRNPDDERAKLVAVTPAGLAALRGALPVAIGVQQRVFGDEGRPGGPLLAALLARLRHDRDAPDR